MKLSVIVAVGLLCIIVVSACAPDEQLEDMPASGAPDEIVLADSHSDEMKPNDASLPVCPERTDFGFDLRSPVAQEWLKRTLPPEATTRISMRIHLDAHAPIVTQPFDPSDTEGTTSYVVSTTVWDFLGETHPLQIWFAKTDVAIWAWHAVVPGEDIEGAPVDRPYEGARGALHFDPSGTLIGTETAYSRWTFWGTPPDARISFDFGPVSASAVPPSQQTRQVAPPPTLNSLEQDGYPVAAMSGFLISDAGDVTGIFRNGQARSFGRCRWDEPTAASAELVR